MNFQRALAGTARFLPWAAPPPSPRETYPSGRTHTFPLVRTHATPGAFVRWENAASFGGRGKRSPCSLSTFDSGLLLNRKHEAVGKQITVSHGAAWQPAGGTGRGRGGVSRAQGHRGLCGDGRREGVGTGWRWTRGMGGNGDIYNSVNHKNKVKTNKLIKSIWAEKENKSCCSSNVTFSV